MDGWKVTGYAIVVISAILLGLAIRNGNMEFALGVLAGTMAASFFYSGLLKRRGEVISDERTVRIEEIASRRTLQVLVLVLAFSVVVLSILTESRPYLRSAYYLAIGLMVLVAVLKLGLRHYYERVM